MPDPQSAELLRELINRRPEKFYPVGNRHVVDDPLNVLTDKSLPQVAPPPMGRAGTLTGGIPRVTKAVEDLFKIAPELRGRISAVDVNPDKGLMEQLLDGGFDPGNVMGTNLEGNFNYPNRNVSLNPGLLNFKNSPTTRSLEGTLAHEFGHASGLGHGPKIDEAKRLGRDLFDPPTWAPKTLSKPSTRIENDPMGPDPIEHIINSLRKAGIKFEVK